MAAFSSSTVGLKGFNFPELQRRRTGTDVLRCRIRRAREKKQRQRDSSYRHSSSLL